jgi:ATP-binding cassette subfamily B protein
LSYLKRYRAKAYLPYFFLIIATLAQLAVPKLVGNILDAITRGARVNMVRDALAKIPEGAMPQALPNLLTTLNLPPTWSVQQLLDQITADAANAPGMLLTAGLAIVLFGIIRGVFSFLQAYWGERNSQAVAYDIRNELYSKVQQLSF